MSNSETIKSVAAVSPEPSIASAVSIWPLLLLALGTFAVGTDAFVLSALMPAIASDLSESIPKVGQIMTIFAVTYAVSAPVIAAATAPWPRRTLLIVAQLVFMVGMILQGLGQSLVTIGVGRVVAAVGAAAYTSAATAVAAVSVPPAARGRALAIVMGGLTIATMFGVPLGSVLGEHLGWRATLLVVAACGALAAMGAGLVPNTVVPVANMTARLRILRAPGMARILFTTVATLACGFTMYTYFPTLIQPALESAPIDISIVLFLYGAAGTFGNWLSGRLTDRFGPTRVLQCGLLGMAVAAAVMPFARTDIAYVVPAVILWSASGWATGVPQQHRLVGVAGSVPAVALSLNASANYIGISLGALIGGGVLAWFDASWLGPVAALCAVLASLATFRDCQTLQ